MVRNMVFGFFVLLMVVAPDVVTVPGGPALAPQLQQARAQQRNLYVWYKSSANGRYHGVGPYTYDEALRVADDYERRGYYGVYVGGYNG